MDADMLYSRRKSFSDAVAELRQLRASLAQDIEMRNAVAAQQLARNPKPTKAEKKAAKRARTAARCCQ